MTQFVIYAFMTVSGGGILSEAYAEIMRAAGATERLMELLSAKPDIESQAGAKRLSAPIDGRITLRGVDFSYPNRPEQRRLRPLLV